MYKIKIKDGRGLRIVTEIKRPDPDAVLVIEECKEYTVTAEELNLIVTLGYAELKHITLITPKGAVAIKASYPEAVIADEPPVVPPAPVTPGKPDAKG